MIKFQTLKIKKNNGLVHITIQAHKYEQHEHKKKQLVINFNSGKIFEILNITKAHFLKSIFFIYSFNFNLFIPHCLWVNTISKSGANLNVANSLNMQLLLLSAAYYDD